MSKVREGYKQTKVGVIPEDWKVVKLGDVANVTMGQSPSSNSYNENKIGIPLIQGNADCKNRKTFPRTYTTEKTKECFIDDIIMTVRAPVGAISKSFHNACIGRGVCAIKSKRDNDFLYHYLVNYEQKWNKYSQGSTFTAVNSRDVKNLKIPLPPLKEQQKIAQILSTWDDAISKQEELIVAKEQLKIGLMQRLLSGEVRFSRFDGEWEEVRLGDICNITTGKLNANAMVENGRYVYFTCAKNTYKIDKFAFDTEALLVSGNGANVGYIHYYKGKFNAYQRTYVLDNFFNNIKFIKYILDRYLKLQINREKNEGNTPYITLPTLTKMKIKLPPLKEQQKIAQVLTAADKEIELLKSELTALKEQKRGLMQRLLTGEVRVKI